MNDAATAVSLMQPISTTDTDVQQQQAISIVVGWVLGHSHAQIAALDTVWRHFLDRKVFWS